MSLSEQPQRKADGNLYNNLLEHFIPVSCHYESLLTKNGELIQTIQINGINAEKISKDLLSLRNMVRKSIKDIQNCDNIAFWIHTLEEKIILTIHPKGVLSTIIHDLWRRKKLLTL